jgi:hypothetical protein
MFQISAQGNNRFLQHIRNATIQGDYKHLSQENFVEHKHFFSQNVTQLKKFFYNTLVHFNMCSFCCSCSFLVINVYNQGKNLCSPCNSTTGHLVSSCYQIAFDTVSNAPSLRLIQILLQSEDFSNTSNLLLKTHSRRHVSALQSHHQNFW